MFDKFKQAKKIKDLKSQLSKEKETCEKNGVKVTVNGQMKVENIEINSEADVEEVQDLVKDCTNNALQSIQKTAAKKMQEAGGF
ncbi:MAG: YbaB/EbfC family nucleoid-associated protein [Patescibacteria group bacterium]